MISPQWLELPMSRINFHGPKDVRAIAVLLYFVTDCSNAISLLHFLFIRASVVSYIAFILSFLFLLCSSFGAS